MQHARSATVCRKSTCEAWARRCTELSIAIDRLKLLCAQDALILLCASFSAPMVHHRMRCSPSVDNPALADFDKLLRSTISHATNCNLTDEQWLQAYVFLSKWVVLEWDTYKLQFLSSLALPTYLASAASTASLPNIILEAATSSEDEVFTTYLSKWQGGRAFQVLPCRQTLFRL